MNRLHPYEDHLGGIVDVLAAFLIDFSVVTEMLGELEIYKVNAWREYNCTIYRV